MADDCFRWLDEDAAEGLLRGERVEAPDERVRGQVDRLSGALADLAGVAYANDLELPGEADALAAFRHSRGVAVPERNAPPTASGVEAGRKPPGRLPRIATVVRLVRPVRLAAATAAAGCAIGGAAVALGAVALPMPFDGTHHPLPGNSVTAASSPRPPAGGGSPGASGRAGNGLGPLAGLHGAPGAADGGITGNGIVGSGRATDRGAAGQSDPGGAGALSRRQEIQAILEACEDHRNGTIDAHREAALEAVAHGPGRVDRYCDRLLAPSGGPAKGVTAGPAGGSGGVGNNDKGHGGAGESRYRMPSPTPTPSASPSIPEPSPDVPNTPPPAPGTTPVPAPGGSPDAPDNVLPGTSHGASPTA